MTVSTSAVLFAQALQHSLRVGCDEIGSRPQPALKPGPRVGKALKRRVIALGNHQMAIEAPADLTTHNIGAAQKRKNPLRASRSDQLGQLIRMRPRNTGHGPVQKPPALSWLKRASDAEMGAAEVKDSLTGLSVAKGVDRSGHGFIGGGIVEQPGDLFNNAG